MNNNLSLEENKNIFSLFLNVKDELKNETSELNMNKNSDVLIVDAMNIFIRSFMANPTMNDDGVHVGGIAGFLKSIGHAIKLLKSSRCVIIFDGPGGSARRRALYKEYKQNRKTSVRVNRIYEDIADLSDEEENMKRQIMRSVQYLEYLPVNMLSIDNVEADDTIAYCALQYFKERVTIMSSDKDFLQLVNDRINIWSPTKKKIYGTSEVYSEYEIHPNNFVFFRALVGDPSDNISGIRGFGLKTILKAFPMMGQDRKLDKEDLYSHALENKKKMKVYDNFLESKSDFERNIELMQLSDTYLPTYAQLHINECLDKKPNKLNRYGFTNLVREDKMSAALPLHISWVNEVFGNMDSII